MEGFEPVNGVSLVTTWIAVLSDSGLLHGERQAQGVAAAARIVGEERLAELRGWLSTQHPAFIERQRSAAIELCIWMSVVDRVLDPREREMLKEIILSTQLKSEESERLLALLTTALGDVRRIAHVETLAEVLDHPTLRELMLAMTWSVAMIDGFVDDLEVANYHRLAAIFGVEPAAAQRIQELLSTP